MNKPYILILGATSAIAQAYARQCAAHGAAFVLVGRREDRLTMVVADLIARGAISAEFVTLDLSAMNAIEAAVQELRSRFGQPAEVLVAYSVLGEQAESERNLEAARSIFDTNLTSAALWILALLKNHPVNAPLIVIAIGSVAGDRGRASNFIYGATKAGLDCVLEGLAQKYDGSAVHILTVKPGLVDTPMTAAMEKGLLWASPDRVAADIHRAVTRGRRVIYTPWFWRPIMAIIRNLPWFIFRRLKV